MKKRLTLFSILWRSFFLQAVWNFEGLQNLGFAYGLVPVLKILYPDPGQRRDALLRHTAFFNTHPYMVTIIYGFVASLEEDIKNGAPVNVNSMTALKNNMAGPLAAIGDTFFWATWRPFTALVGIGASLLFYQFDNFLGTWFAPLLFLTVYNLVHLPFRYWTLAVSYELKNRTVEIIAGLEFQYVVDIVRMSGLVLLIAIALFYGWSFSTSGTERACFAGVFIVSVAAGCTRVPPLIIVLGTIAISVGILLLKGIKGF